MKPTRLSLSNNYALSLRHVPVAGRSRSRQYPNKGVKMRIAVEIAFKYLIVLIIFSLILSFAWGIGGFVESIIRGL